MGRASVISQKGWEYKEYKYLAIFAAHCITKILKTLYNVHRGI